MEICKKRALSFILTLALLVGCFAGTGFTARAAGDRYLIQVRVVDREGNPLKGVVLKLQTYSGDETKEEKASDENVECEEEETQMMEEDIQSLTALGADGIVVGSLCADGMLDREKMKRFRQAAGDVPITLHRAFDMCREPERVMEEAIALGISTILTSGQAKNCREGAERIKQMICQAGDRISVLVGGGVNGENIPQLMQETKATWFHMSGKVSLKSGMLYRKAEVHMGIPGMDEYQILRTSEELVRQAKAALGRRSGLGN